MFGEEVFWSGAKRDPLVPVVVRIAMLGPLVNEDGHDGELFAWLKQQVLCDEKSFRAVDERRWIRDRRAEVAGRSGSVLDGKRVIAPVPLQALMAQPECVSVGCADHGTVGGRAAFRGGEIEPAGPETQRPLQVIEANVDVALREVPVLRDNVGPRPRKERHRHLADSKIDILNAPAVPAHVEHVEIVDIDVLPTIKPFTRPELGVWLAFQHIPDLNEGFTQAKLIVADAI